MEKRIVLVDLDGPVADREEGFFRIWRERHPDLPFIFPRDRRHFYLTKDYPEECRELIEEIIYEEHFARDLPIVPGAYEAIDGLQSSGKVVVRICSTLMDKSPTNADDKRDWVGRCLENYFRRTMIFTEDKTLIRGHFLIDDKQVIRGGMVPTWKHHIYRMPYNCNIPPEELFTWDMWPLLLE